MGGKYSSLYTVLLLLYLNGVNAEYNINITITQTEELSRSCPVQTIQCKTSPRYTNTSVIPCEKNSDFVISDLIDELNFRNQLSCEDVIDEPCLNNKQETRCGACRTNFSLVLGSLNCRQCSNIYLLLILPFALAGMVLIVILLKCNLTVSNGHINGIIFYANVVHVKETIFFPTQTTAYKVFSAFVAWLNLDFGIETCFYESMDAYAKVWLQFVFPLYLWFLVILVIIFKKYSKLAARFVTGNSASDLAATVFILSYAKLLSIVIAAISFTHIEKEDGSMTQVWLLDGNVEYFSPKHISLFTVALLFALVYLLPLTLVVLFTPCLQAKSHYKVLRWVSKVKPFLDAYNVPYNDKFHHWTGLMLIVRIFLFIVFAANYEQDPSMDYFLIVMIIGPLGLFVLIKRNHTVYRSTFANILEVVSLLNIVILSTVNWLLTSTKYRNGFCITTYVTYASLGVLIILFLVVVFYQIMLQFCPQVFIKTRRRASNDHDNNERLLEETAPMNTMSCSVMELSQAASENLKEPLLDSQQEEST